MEVQRSDLCRLCLVSINGCDEILLNENDYLIKLILLIAGLEVASDPGQLEYICSQCHDFLKQCVEFRNTCINNNGVFHEMMTSPNYVEDCRSEPLKPETNQLAESLCDEVKEKDLQNPAVECIKHEPVDLGEPADDISEASENNHLLPNEDDEPSVGRKSETDDVDSKKRPKAKKKKSKKQYPRKFIQCQQCGKVMESCRLNEHLVIHDPNRKKLPCPHCPKQYVKARTLQDHIHANHTEGVQYACDECGVSFTARHSYIVHQVAVHSGEKRYACSVCGEKFARSSSRNYHQQTAHSTLRPFTCEYCDKTFKTKSHLTHHTRFHMGYKQNRKRKSRS